MRLVPTRVRTWLDRYGALLWLAFVLLLSAWFGWQNQDELRQVGASLVDARPGWIAALVLIECAILVAISMTYRTLLRHFGYAFPLSTLVGVHLQRIVVGTVTPVGGPASIAIFVHRLRQRGVRVADSLLAVSLASVIGNIAFLFILLPVVILQEPSVVLLVSTAALVLLAGATTWLLSMALTGRKPPSWLIRRLSRKWLRFLADARTRKVRPRVLIGPFIYLLATRLGGALMLMVALRAVGETPGIRVPLAAYVVGMVFLLVAPVFQGIGIVEVGMSVALERLGVPAAAAISATLLTRVGELWLPLLAGIVMQIVGLASTGGNTLADGAASPTTVRTSESAKNVLRDV